MPAWTICSPIPALAVAACLTPTDPLLVHSIVKGKEECDNLKYDECSMTT